MKKLLYISAALLLIFTLSGAESISTNTSLTSKSNENPPDVLSATNLEQWKSLIKDLKQDKALRDNWLTSRFRPGTPPVLLKHNGQSIIYKAEAIDVSVLPKTTEFMEAQIYSPKMNIDETRALGTNLCGMFGFDTNKFSIWCSAASTNEEMPVFSIGDHSHFFNVRPSFNNEKPWFIIFTIQDENAVSKLKRKSAP